MQLRVHKMFMDVQQRLTCNINELSQWIMDTETSEKELLLLYCNIFSLLWEKKKQMERNVYCFWVIETDRNNSLLVWETEISEKDFFYCFRIIKISGILLILLLLL